MAGRKKPSAEKAPRKRSLFKRAASYWEAQPGELVETDTITIDRQEVTRGVFAVKLEDLDMGTVYLTVSQSRERLTLFTGTKVTPKGHENDRNRIVFVFRPLPPGEAANTEKASRSSSS